MNVFGGCYPFQIRDVIVSFIAVDVIDLRLIVRIRDERLSNKSVNKRIFRLAVFAERDAQVTRMNGVWFEEFCFAPVKRPDTRLLTWYLPP